MALETIKDWDSRKKCELAIWAALAVSKTKEGGKFRKHAGKLCGSNGRYNSVLGSISKWRFSPETSYDHSLEIEALYNAVSSTWYLHNDLCDMIEFMYCICESLRYAKLCAMARGEEFELIELTRELTK